MNMIAKPTVTKRNQYGKIVKEIDNLEKLLISQHEMGSEEFSEISRLRYRMFNKMQSIKIPETEMSLEVQRSLAIIPDDGIVY